MLLVFLTVSSSPPRVTASTMKAQFRDLNQHHSLLELYYGIWGCFTQLLSIIIIDRSIDVQIHRGQVTVPPRINKYCIIPWRHSSEISILYITVYLNLSAMLFCLGQSMDVLYIGVKELCHQESINIVSYHEGTVQHHSLPELMGMRLFSV